MTRIRTVVKELIISNTPSKDSAVNNNICRCCPIKQLKPYMT